MRNNIFLNKIYYGTCFYTNLKDLPYGEYLMIGSANILPVITDKIYIVVLSVKVDFEGVFLYDVFYLSKPLTL